jgi:carbonic anhydrase
MLFDLMGGFLKKEISLKCLPAEEGKSDLADEINVADVLPATLKYYGFNGSLTTPPCSEGVAWHVVEKPIELSKAQIIAFKKIFKTNARPVQPLNGRVVEESK